MKSMNKKGFALTGIMIIAFLVVIGVVSFLVSPTIRYTIIGVGIISLTIYMTITKGISGEITRQGLILIIIFLIIGVFVMFIPKIELFQMTGFDSDIIYKVRWGRLECIKDQSPVDITVIVPEELLEYTEYKCGTIYLLDECKYFIKGEDVPWYASKPKVGYKICDYGGVSCSAPTYKNADEFQFEFLVDVPNGKSLLITRWTPWKIELKKLVYPYRLWTIEGGKWLTNSADCALANQNELERKQFQLGDWVTLTKTGSNQVKNYMIDWIPTVGKIYTYENEDIVCANNIIYDLEEKQMADGSTIKIQGEAIIGVDCCPYQTSNCDINTFKFITIDEEDTQSPRDCTFSYECENGGIPWTTSDIEAIQEICIDSKCIPNILNIECGSDAKCVELYGQGYVCDLTFKNFGKCIEAGLLPKPFCGDRVCQTGETFQNCPVDCSNSILLDKEKCLARNKPGSFRYEWIEAVDYPWYQFWNKDKPGICKDNWRIFYILGIIGGIILLIVIILVFTDPKKSKQNGSSGITQHINQAPPKSVEKKK